MLPDIESKSVNNLRKITMNRLTVERTDHLQCEAVSAIAEVHALKSEQDAMKLYFYRFKFQSKKKKVFFT